MQKLEVFGANQLKGKIKISGSKNASLPILAATLLSNKKIRLKNLPKVKDIEISQVFLLPILLEITHQTGILRKPITDPVKAIVPWCS